MPRPTRPLSALLTAALVLATGCTAADPAKPTAAPIAKPDAVLASDDFSDPATLDRDWQVEQQPGGEVTIAEGCMTIRSTGGTTVWFRYKQESPLIIRYKATVTSGGRISDLNCFWMASDPQHPVKAQTDEINFSRSGKFADYDSLKLYYVGCGGNTNSTTRFRRYAGDGAKPLLPEHDLTDAAHLLEADHTYEITIIVVDGRTQWLRDGVVVFDYADPEPLKAGWFGFRTVDSRIEIRDFKIFAPEPPAE